MFGFILLLCAACGFVESLKLPLETHWESFKVNYNKQYADRREELRRMQIFKNNKDIIDRHNSNFEAGGSTYMMGVNQFTDLMPQEFQKHMMSVTMNTSHIRGEMVYSPRSNMQLPESVDWRTKKAVSGVKHQGWNCGSCWAFAAVGTLEGQYYLKHTRMLEFSEQNLLDCSSLAPYKNKGCDGGSPQEALRYIKENKGINPRASYAYEEHVGKCRYDKGNVGVTIQGSVDVKSGDEAALAAAVAEKGPISVTMDGTHLQHYKSGVYNTPCTGTAKYHHSILLVGYGKDAKLGEFWLLKNSWGKWGEDGYFRMARGHNNLCSIATWGVYPIL